MQESKFKNAEKKPQIGYVFGIKLVQCTTMTVLKSIERIIEIVFG